MTGRGRGGRGIVPVQYMETISIQTLFYYSYMRIQSLQTDAHTDATGRVASRRGGTKQPRT